MIEHKSPDCINVTLQFLKQKFIDPYTTKSLS